ncbi:MAG: hypothetical protein ACTSUE_01990 [Promethearchaeota archaeon]
MESTKEDPEINDEFYADMTHPYLRGLKKEFVLKVGRIIAYEKYEERKEYKKERMEFEKERDKQYNRNSLRRRSLSVIRNIKLTRGMTFVISCFLIALSLCLIGLFELIWNTERKKCDTTPHSFNTTTGECFDPYDFHGKCLEWSSSSHKCVRYEHITKQVYLKSARPTLYIPTIICIVCGILGLVYTYVLKRRILTKAQEYSLVHGDDDNKLFDLIGHKFDALTPSKTPDKETQDKEEEEEEEGQEQEKEKEEETKINNV